MLVEYTCSGQIANGHAYTLVAYTCGGQIANGHAYTLVAYTCGWQIARGMGLHADRIHLRWTNC